MNNDSANGSMTTSTAAWDTSRQPDCGPVGGSALHAHDLGDAITVRTAWIAAGFMAIAGAVFFSGPF